MNTSFGGASIQSAADLLPQQLAEGSLCCQLSLGITSLGKLPICKASFCGQPTSKTDQMDIKTLSPWSNWNDTVRPRQFQPAPF